MFPHLESEVQELIIDLGEYTYHMSQKELNKKKILKNTTCKGKLGFRLQEAEMNTNKKIPK